MKLAIINYGMGNLGSVYQACMDLGAEVFIAENPGELTQAGKIILPGVGNFFEGAKRLYELGWKEVLETEILEKGKPLLGICLGMQLLATVGDEGGPTKGLDFIPGKVRRLDQLGCSLRIPHVGWNDVHITDSHFLFQSIPTATDFYFVHSYAFDSLDPQCVIASVEYGSVLTAAISHDSIFGVQFHPEKSSKAGRCLLKNFLDYQSC